MDVEVDDDPAPPMEVTYGEAYSAAMRQPPPPCASGCPHFDRCARMRLACRAFGRYLQGEAWEDAAREPSRGIYIEIGLDARELRLITPGRRPGPPRGRPRERSSAAREVT